MYLYPIVSRLEHYSDSIIENLTEQDIQVYQFIKDEFACTDVSKNKVFQFVYSHFYTLDNLKVTPEFKNKYFEIMEELRATKQIDIESILFKLYDIPVRGKNKYHYSFASKLAHTLDENFPIWDSMIRKVFGYVNPKGNDPEKLGDDFRDLIENIQSAYQQIIKEDLLIECLTRFDEKFKDNNISTLKKIDFIFWSAGKLKITEMLFGDNGMHTIEELDEIDKMMDLKIK
jgi:hypothetical protein